MNRAYFLDCNAKPTFVESCFWSHSSKILVSRHPKSSIEELMSSFCPQCFTKYTPDETVQYKGKCPTCFICFRCQSVTSIHAFSDEHFFLCSSCGWNSSEISLIGSSKQELLAKCALSGKGSKEFTHINQQVVDFSINSRVSLIVRRILRSRFDFENNKLSLLIQPKSLPLDGDSSLRFHLNKGKWWMKDSSIVHEIPLISICQLNFNNSKSVVRLHLWNPKDESVTVRLSFFQNNHEHFRYFDFRYFILNSESHNLLALPLCDYTPIEVTIGPNEDELLRESTEHVLHNSIDNPSQNWTKVSSNTADVYLPYSIHPQSDSNHFIKANLGVNGQDLEMILLIDQSLSQ